MKTVFHKKHLQKMNKILDKTISGREHWDIAASMYREDGLTWNSQVVNMQLLQGAFQGDVWSMTQLARNYMAMNQKFLPQALSWWKKAIMVKDTGALSDRKNYSLKDKILNYKSSDSEFSDMVIKCAMLAEWTLTDLGYTDWASLSLADKVDRVQKLTDDATKVLHIDPIKIIHNERPVIADIFADGLAHPQKKMIEIRDGVFDHYPRLIAVLFHEIGHFVTYSMWDTSTEKAKEQMARYGIRPERVFTWYSETMQEGAGERINTKEADADTLSYNVQLAWMTLFA